jgi:DNA-binding FadR family transcriptional regulator
MQRWNRGDGIGDNRIVKPVQPERGPRGPGAKGRRGAGTSSRAESAAHRTARLLREQILEREDGEFLGAEDELMRRLGVSRPTLRQAARLLENEQALVVRRGVKGGYYARKTDVGAVAHLAAFHLRARDTTLWDTAAASEPLIDAAILRAATASDPAARRRFAQAMATFTPAAQRPPAATVGREETEFIAHVLELAGNPVIELFVRILYQFGLSQTSTRVFANHPERIQAWAESRERIASAIVAGDAEMAILLRQRRGRAWLAWMTEDEAQGAAAAAASCAAGPGAPDARGAG